MTKSAAKAAPTGRAPRKQAAELPPPPEAKGKLGAIVDLMRRPEGARLEELMALTGWQAHSVRGAIAGAVKAKLGLKVTSEKSDAGRVYRIAPARAS